ncbi:beta strand repeat-containing protein [Microvirga flavescens]|uniref:beta strand repeat-containing protein n=1 Tax=Microvirga flavescens TaxID=2249811 RepID=UPI000DDBD1A1|nr:calcium-binding protein [Microvirga flavescens]
MPTYNSTSNTYTLDIGEVVAFVMPTTAGNASVIGNDLANVITGNGGNNHIEAGGGDDVIIGADGADTLIGADGNDILDGGVGADTLVGGEGRDSYYVDHEGDLVVEDPSLSGVDTVHASISYRLTVGVENLTLVASAGDLNGTGNDLNNILNGNEGNNSLDGGLGDDTLIGGGGVDTLRGGAGDDTYWYDGTSLIIEDAGGGSDTFVVSAGFDLRTVANIENLSLSGAANIDAIGNDAANKIYGNNGNNHIDGGLGADLMAGGGGDDTYIVESIGDIVVEYFNGGRDTVRSSISFTLGANVENLVLTGSANLSGVGNELGNALTGNSGNNTLDGGDGNDTFEGGAGTDTLQGGNGDDVYIVSDTNDIIIEVDNLGRGGLDEVRSSVSFALGAYVENLVLTGSEKIDGTGNELDNKLIGNSADNVLDGGAGNDTLQGGAGNDTLRGGSGEDTLEGGAGDDVYFFDYAKQIVELAGQGIDTVITTSNYVLAANIENLTAATASLSLTGNELNNLIVADLGSNHLDGGAGADTLQGGADTDFYVVDNVGDVIIELAGGGENDNVTTSVSYTLSANVEALHAAAGFAPLVLTGNAFNNVITGNDGDNTLDGGAGADWLQGGLGNDTYIIDSAADWVLDTGGVDTVITSASVRLDDGVEILKAVTGTTKINLTGNDQNNVIEGNDGANRIDGGAGTDQLRGGKGKDVFIFGAKPVAANRDKILDFSVKDDSIYLDNAVFKKLGKGTEAKTGKLLKDFFVIGSKAQDKNDYLIYNDKKGVLYYDADGSGKGKAVEIATLSKKLVMTEKDFFII